MKCHEFARKDITILDSMILINDLDLPKTQFFEQKAEFLSFIAFINFK